MRIRKISAIALLILALSFACTGPFEESEEEVVVQESEEEMLVQESKEEVVVQESEEEVVVQESEEKVLNLLYWQAPSIPFAYLAGGEKDRDASSITLEALAEYDQNGNLVPVLATEIPTVQNGGVSEDLTTITWKLKKDIKWSDGSDMTTEDVVFTWGWCIDPDTGCTGSSAFDPVTNIEAVDNLTVKITFDAPTPYPYTVFVGTGAQVISKSQFENCVGAAVAGCTEQTHAPLGTGAYRILSFTPEVEAVYERNPHFRGDEPYFDKVVMKGSGDALSSGQSVFGVGDADYAWNLQVTPEELEELEQQGEGVVVSAFSSLIERIVVNQTNADPSLGDDRSEYMDGQNPHPFLTYEPIKRAMSMAIDRKLLTDELYGSVAGRPTCNIIDGPPNYVSSANDDCLDQDIPGANALLDDSGVLDSDGDGIREYNGVPLKVVYQTSTNEVRQATQEYVQDWWSQIGIEAEIVHHDGGLFFGGDPIENPDESYRRFWADIQMFAGSSGVDPQLSLYGGTCENIDTRENNWSSGNVSRGCDPAYDALYEQLAATPLGPERAELVKQMNDIFVQNYFEIPLVNRGYVSGHHKSIRGVKLNAWDSEIWNIDEWYRVEE